MRELSNEKSCSIPPPRCSLLARCLRTHSPFSKAARSYDVQPVKAEQLGEQQKISDAFFAAGLLPKTVDAKEVDIWTP